MNHFDVIIVGLGPTGSITALLLESYGIKVLGIEKEKEVYNLPRAVTISDQGLEFLNWQVLTISIKKIVQF